MRLSPVPLVLLAAALLAPAAAADTTVPGGNVINQTWTAAGSPYVVQGDVTVPAGSTLRILAGAVVRFASSDGQGSGRDTGRVELTVRGTLRVEGTNAAPVSFISASTSDGSWYGVDVAADAALVHVRHLQITDALRAISYYAPRAAGDLANVRITDSADAGIYAAGQIAIDAVEIVGSPAFTDTAVEVPTGGAAELDSCILRGASYGVENSGSASLDHCTVVQNSSAGVRIWSNAATTTVRDSIVEGNNYGVRRDGTSGVAVTHSNVWGNGVNLENVSAGAGHVSANPLFVSTTDLRLTSNSPSRFGDAAGGDQGARPFDGVPTPDVQGVLWTSIRIDAGASRDVVGDLTVPAGRTLTVEPGARLRFAASDAQGSGRDTGRVELTVRGTLRVEGTGAAPVDFVGASTTDGSWYGVDVTASAALVHVRHLQITDALRAISYYAPRAAGDLANVRITDSADAGIYAAGQIAIDAVEIVGSPAFTDTAVEVPTGGGAELDNCILRGASYGVENSGSASLDHCTVVQNSSAGVRIWSNAATTTVRNSIVEGNNYGVRRDGTSGVAVTHSNVWGNGVNLENVSVGAGHVSANPLFVSTTDLRLQPSSVCIDAGAPGMDHDIVGTVRPLDGDGIGAVLPDMGAHEYVPAAACGNGVVEPGEACDSGADNGEYGHCNSDCSGEGPGCGDGAVNGPEQCDDGNTSDSDACIGTCRFATCGDGFVRAGVEQCDDGNTSNSDACVGACQLATCGDGYQWVGAELCDDGNSSNSDACVGSCVPAACGDGHVRTGVEACDDGNGSNGDACLNSCVAATCGDGHTRTGVEDCDDGNGSNTDACLNGCAAASCGDAFVHAGVEDCDDGNGSNTDACLTSCVGASCGDGFLRTGVEECDDGNVVGTDACTNACTAARCGDGVVRSGLEECDDGNPSNTDACVAGCHAAACGDGYVQGGVEACDDGNTSNGDACSAVCALPSCGNGTVEGGEQCDDGNSDDGDACPRTCQAARCGDGVIRRGVETCDDGNDDDSDACVACAAARCGDGVVHDGVEECDDGNDVDSDACRRSCDRAVCGDGVVEAGVETCDDGNGVDDDACTNACRSASCGDGVVQAGVEECDDGNDVDGDACPTTCRAARCGDGIVRAGAEACDDGNTADGDGCSSACAAEPATMPDAGVPGTDAGVPGTDAGGPDAGVPGTDAGMEPPPDGSCSAGGGGAGAGLIVIAALLARRRRRA